MKMIQLMDNLEEFILKREAKSLPKHFLWAILNALSSDHCTVTFLIYCLPFGCESTSSHSFHPRTWGPWHGSREQGRTCQCCVQPPGSNCCGSSCPGLRPGLSEYWKILSNSSEPPLSILYKSPTDAEIESKLNSNEKLNNLSPN